MKKKLSEKNRKNGGSKPSSGDADLLKLEKLFHLMQRNQVTELEWEKAGERLRLRCGTEAAQPLETQVRSAQPQASAVSVALAPTTEPAKPMQNTTSKQITSPFVGTFYRSPSPTAEPYVREGQTVKRGDVLCIIEAMKLMNEIEAEASGKIVSVLVENGQPVEFGEPLFILEPAI